MFAVLAAMPPLVFLMALVFWHGAWPAAWQGHDYPAVAGQSAFAQEAAASRLAGREFLPLGIWALRAVRAQEAWEALERAGKQRAVRVGLHDGVLDPTHPDFAPTAAAQWEDPGPRLLRWLAGDGHGTQLWGVIAGRGLPGMTGVNPDAELVVMGTHTTSQDAGKAAALRFFAAHHVRVANFSVATPWPVVSQTEVDTAYQQGVLLVTGLFNDDTDAPAHPAAVLRTLAVSLADEHDRPGGKGWGPGLDLLAPGPWMHSTAPRLEVLGVPLGRPYRLICCNSVAVAIATGAASLVVASDPTLTSAQLEKRLKLSARKPPGMQGALWHSRYGYGVVDAYAAVTYDTTGPVVVDATLQVGSDTLTLSGEARDSADDNRLLADRPRDRHLFGVPVSNIAAVHFSREQAPSAGWSSLPLDGQRFASTLPRAGGNVQIRAIDTAGNLGPVLVVPVP